MSACDYARDGAVRELLTLGADWTLSKKDDNTRAVHRAASSALSSGPASDPNSIAAANCVETLIDADVGKFGKGDYSKTIDRPSDIGTPFLCACARGAELTITMLAKRGCNTHVTTPANVGAVTLATSSGVLGALKACLASNAPTDLRPPGGMTALHVAASHPNCAEVSLSLVELLLQRGADANALDGEGMKAIHAAACVGRVDVVEALVNVTTPDDGISKKDWTVSAAQKAAQEKMKHIYEKHGDKSMTASHTKPAYKAPTNEPKYVPTGIINQEIAGLKKREGDEAFVKGDDASALKAYDEAIANDDTNAKVFANRAAVKLRMKGTTEGVAFESLESARVDARIARTLDPNYIKAWYREGIALTELNDYESAALAFFEGMQIDGDNADLKKGFDAAIKKGREANMKK